jgi:hypothetical protein
VPSRATVVRHQISKWGTAEPPGWERVDAPRFTADAHCPMEDWLTVKTAIVGLIALAIVLFWLALILRSVMERKRR